MQNYLITVSNNLLLTLYMIIINLI